MVKATHIDYLHPRHLRFIDGSGAVLCMAPSASRYDKLAVKGLPKWRGE